MDANSSSARNSKPSRTSTRLSIPPLPSDKAALRRWRQEQARLRQEANRMSPEKKAEFLAWVEEKTSQLLPGNQHLLVPPPPGVEPPRREKPGE